MIEIRKMEVGDWGAVQSIYGEGIDTHNATFEVEVPEWEKWNQNHLINCRLVAINRDEVVGWATLSPISNRCIYSGVAEVSIYIKASERKKGIGKILLKALIEKSEDPNIGIWTLQAGIFPENVDSISIHETNGFHIVGKRERIGQMNGVWRDTLLLERRSKNFN